MNNVHSNRCTHQPRSGSILLLALVAVSTATTLIVALALWVTAQRNGLREVDARRQARSLLRHHLILELEADPSQSPAPSGSPSLLAAAFGQSATNSTRPAWETLTDDWRLRFSGTRWESDSTEPLTCEEAKINIAKAPPELIAALLRVRRPELTREQALEIAPRISRPLEAIEQLYLIPEFHPAIADAIPFLTTYGSGEISLVHANETVLAAMLAAAGASLVDAQNLAARLVLPTADGSPPSIPAALTPTQIALLTTLPASPLSNPVTYSGVAEAARYENSTKNYRVVLRTAFIWDRSSRRLLRWLEIPNL